MTRAKWIGNGRLHPVLELCGWSLLLVLAIWKIVHQPSRGSFLLWFEAAASILAIGASALRLLSGGW